MPVNAHHPAVRVCSLTFPFFEETMKMKTSKTFLIMIIMVAIAVNLTILTQNTRAAKVSGEVKWDDADTKFSVTADIVMTPISNVEGKIKYACLEKTMPDISGTWSFPKNIVASANVVSLCINGDGGPGSIAVAAGPVTAIYDPSDQTFDWLVFYVKKGEAGSGDQVKVCFVPEGDTATPGTARYLCANPAAASSLSLVQQGNFTINP
jgi:hypothetical protein